MLQFTQIHQNYTIEDRKKFSVRMVGSEFGISKTACLVSVVQTAADVVMV